MKKYLLPLNSKYFKANLHTHSTLSDGEKTPEQIKADYMAHGYSIVAFTDHDLFITHNDMSDKNFVALNGFELEYDKNNIEVPTCHICCIAKDQDKVDIASDVALYKTPRKKKQYSVDFINKEISIAKEEGFFVTYNHPSWSMERYPEYSQYKGIDAMEIANYNALSDGYSEDNGRVYEDFISLGHRIFCIATDDNHNRHAEDSIYNDSYGGYVQFALEDLSYTDVISALKSGNFYSCACVNPGNMICPKIVNLWFENRTVHVEAEGASSIVLIKDRRPYSIMINEDGLDFMQCDFDILDCNWFRIVVSSRNGNKAYSNAYFVDEL